MNRWAWRTGQVALVVVVVVVVVVVMCVCLCLCACEWCVRERNRAVNNNE